MVLVDTSVLIEFLKNKDTPETQQLEEIIDLGIPYGICSFIFQELLQGVRTEKQFKILRKYLETQRFYELTDGRNSYASAALLFYKCQKAGITVRKSIDLLIAQIAIENNLRLLHNDRDFSHIAAIEKKLFIYKPGL